VYVGADTRKYTSNGRTWPFDKVAEVRSLNLAPSVASLVPLDPQVFICTVAILPLDVVASIQSEVATVPALLTATVETLEMEIPARSPAAKLMRYAGLSVPPFSRTPWFGASALYWNSVNLVPCLN
jgi:hypothetical protein